MQTVLWYLDSLKIRRYAFIYIYIMEDIKGRVYEVFITEIRKITVTTAQYCAHNGRSCYEFIPRHKGRYWACR